MLNITQSTFWYHLSAGFFYSKSAVVRAWIFSQQNVPRAAHLVTLRGGGGDVAYKDNSTGISPCGTYWRVATVSSLLE